MKIMSTLEFPNINAIFNEKRLLQRLQKLDSEFSEFIIRYYDDFRFERISHCIITEYCEVSQNLIFSVQL